MPGRALASRHHGAPSASRMKSTLEKSRSRRARWAARASVLNAVRPPPGKIRREDLLGHPRAVLALVVEELVRRE